MFKAGMLVAVEIDSVFRKYGEPYQVDEVPGYKVFRYKTDRYELYIVKSGAGQISAAAAVQFLITAYQVDMIVNFGVVGGLTPEMSVVHTAIIDRCVHYDFDTSEIDNCEVGRYMNYPDIWLRPTAELVEKALQIDPSIKKVSCASGDKFIGNKERKEALHKQFGADICEMEAAAIIMTCDRNKIPCLLIKTVSDSLEGGADEYYRHFSNSGDTCLEITDRIIREMTL